MTTSSTHSFYAENGYAVEKNASLEFKKKVSDAFQTYDQLDRDPHVLKWWHGADQSAKHRLNPHLRYPVFKDLILSQPVLDFARTVLNGQRGYISHSKISIKEQGRAQAWLPHQDAGYKSGHSNGFTVSIFLEDANEMNGTLQLFPGSHKLGRLPVKRITEKGDFYNQITLEKLPDIDPLTIDAKAGDILFFSSYTVHQSHMNRSSGKRLLFIFEIEPLNHYVTDDHGRIPLIVNGRMSLLEKAMSLASYWLNPQKGFRWRVWAGHLKQKMLNLFARRRSISAAL